MVKNYEFKLAPAYCLYNGVAIVFQKGAEINFLIENFTDEILKGRLTRAFCNFVDFVIRQSDSPEIFKRIPVINFKQSERKVIRSYISKLYGIIDDEPCSEIEKVNNEKNIQEDQKKNEAAAVLLLDGILFEARNKKATDIHIEKNFIRFRINGLLEDYMEITRERKNQLIQRIKLLGGMNSLEKRKNQDGHFIYGDSNPIFVRVSSVSVIDDKYDNDESVVLRLLDTSRIPLSINFLGFNDKQLEKLNEVCQLKNGLVLICGPTCSGKSTTAASMLVEIEKLNYGKFKIISLEDPPEYIIPGISQLKIDINKGNTFENSLDYIFRQDPDVIMIGEIRDEITANTAIRAALTGHLVFATLHTSNPGEAVLRLNNLRINRKIITSVVKCVVIQNLTYLGDMTTLYADVAIPNFDFSWAVNDDMGSEEIDDYYIHYTNYMDGLSKNIKLMGDFRKKSMKTWERGSYGAEVYRHIV